jgi:transglutaminase-like putative cysteine protease
VHIRSAALELAAAAPNREALADTINSWVYAAMSYGAGATTVETTAAEALAIGQGLCQDYAHIMLAMCRCAGLAARYVSGHMLGEGGSHAWVEVLLPDGESYRAVAFDPTNHRRITPSYITIATGRDYRDVAPTAGTYIAPYAGRLEAHKRAGITHCEYFE